MTQGFLMLLINIRGPIRIFSVCLLSPLFGFIFVKFVNQLDSYPSPWSISAPCNWLSQFQTTMVRLTSCIFIVLQHSNYRLSNVPKSLSLWPFLTVEALRPLPYTGKIQPCFESQFLHDSGWTFHSTGRVQKNQPHTPFPILTLLSACLLRCCIAFTYG